MISFEICIHICHILTVYESIFPCILIEFFFWDAEKWTKYISRNNRHAGKPTDFSSFSHTHQNSLNLIIRMMCCEDIFGTIFFFHLTKKTISFLSCDMFDTFFCCFRESSDIHFLYFADDVFTIANICNKFSICIRFISSEWMIKVYNDEFFFCMVLFDHIKKYHTIHSPTYRENKDIWGMSIFWKCF